MRVLLAEDDPLLREGITEGLRQHGFQVDSTQDGVATEREAARGIYDALVLDLGLPRLDGIEVLRKVRSAGLTTPVLVLTARDAVADRIQGLDLGADDYVIKPIEVAELAARLRALIRRAHGQSGETIVVGEVVLDPAARTVRVRGEDAPMTTREFDLLQTLMLSAGRVLTREVLEQRLYSWGYEVESNAIEVHIHHLRRKLGPGVIETVRGVGYIVRAPGAGG
jgi:two-component system response regulator QseB